MDLKRKPIQSKLKAMDIDDSIVYSFVQRTSVETTRDRMHKQTKLRFSIATIDEFSFRITRIA